MGSKKSTCVACRPRLFHPVSCRSPYHRPNSKGSPFEIWTDAASPENAFRSGLVTWENDPRPPNAAVDSICYRAPSERASFGHNFLQTHNECAFSLRQDLLDSHVHQLPGDQEHNKITYPRQRSSIPDFRKAGRCFANARQYHLAIFNTEDDALHLDRSFGPRG